MTGKGSTCLGCLPKRTAPKGPPQLEISAVESKQDHWQLPALPDELEKVLVHASLGTRFLQFEDLPPFHVGASEEDEEMTPTVTRHFSLLAVSTLADEDKPLPQLDLSPPTTPVATATLHANFAGQWKMIRCEGDFDSFLKEMGVGWAFRKAAQAAGYGTGSTYHTIKQKDNVFSVTTTNPKGVFQKDFVVDGTEQPEKDPSDGSPLRIIPYWDGDVLHIDTWRESTREPLPVTRRYFSGKEMVMEQTSPQGVVIKRFFERHDK